VIKIKKIEIANEDLIDLYNKGLSSIKIAKKYNCSKRTILIKLHKIGIDLRDPGCLKVRPFKEELEKLYLDKNLPTRKVAEICQCSRSTVHRKLKMYDIERRGLADAEIKYPRKSFNGSLEEKSYLVGFSLGDLRARKIWKNGKTINIAGGSTQINQIELFVSLFSKYGRVWHKQTKSGRYNAEAFLDMSFEFLLERKKNLKWISKNPSYFLAFLAGFTDAEGSIFLSNRQAVYSIGNYDLEILIFIQKNLEKYYGIESKIYLDKKIRITSDGYERNNFYKILRIQRSRSLVSLFELLENNIKHPKRLNQLYLARENLKTRGLISKKIE